jgi:hypothetical protein
MPVFLLSGTHPRDEVHASMLRPVPERLITAHMRYWHACREAGYGGDSVTSGWLDHRDFKRFCLPFEVESPVL